MYLKTNIKLVFCKGKYFFQVVMLLKDIASKRVFSSSKAG